MALVYLFLILMIVLWSFSFIIADIAVDIIPPLSLALYRFIIASASFIVLDFYFKISKKKNFEKNTGKETHAKFSLNQWLLIIIASFTGASLFFFAQYTAIQLIGPSLPALFVCLLAPIIIAVFSLLFFNEKLNSLKIIGFIIASIGGFLLLTGGDINTLTPESPNFLGYLFALLTPLLWGIYTTAIKKISISKPNSEIQIIKFVAYFATIELLIFVVLNNEFWIFFENFLNIIIILSAIYLGIGCYVLGYYI
ncbi:MAG: DMT family transporter, partial [Promethearchaeota archaeon]